MRIIKELALISHGFSMHDIKNEPITKEQLLELKKLAGSYESLFSRVARKYKELNLKNKQLDEDDYERYILEEYTFLKRPVIVAGSQIFIGNSKKTVEAARHYLNT